MKAVLHIDLDDETCEYILSKLKKTDKSQQKLPNDGKESVRKYYCNNPSCEKEISKSEVIYCLHPANKSRFNGKVFCRDCQGEF